MTREQKIDLYLDWAYASEKRGDTLACERYLGWARQLEGGSVDSQG